MEKEAMEPTNNLMSYVLGGLLVLAVVAGGYFLRPKSANPTNTQTAMVQPTPTPGTINKLGCDTQYYNPVIGFPKYYLSVEGGDVGDASEVECTTTVTQEGKVVATEKVTVPLTDKAERNGKVFKCSTSALELKPTVPTKVDILLKNDKDLTATCSAMFALPKS
jgi:hypothetical protein